MKQLYMILILSFIFPYAAAKAPPKIKAENHSPQLIKMSALEFTGVVQQNLKGAFDLFVNDLAQLSNIELDYHVMSPARGAKHFFNGESQCLIPGSLHPPYYQGYNVIHSKSFSKVTYLAFTLPGQEVVIKHEQMKGKIIGVIRDAETWDYVKRFNIEDSSYIQVSNLESLIEMLYKKRIDVAIHDHSDFLALAEYQGKPTPNYDLSAPMAVDKIVITCHDTEQTRRYIEAINPHIDNILATGFRQYFHKSSVD